MNSFSSLKALICPYTLMEEEALAWSILLFNQALILHPFPLPLPASYQSLINRGLLEVRTLERTPEEIRTKNKNLRELQAFIADHPDRSFLEILKERTVSEDLETQEELVGFLKGQPLQTISNDSQLLKGQILLCLIHEWMLQGWEVDFSLAMIEEQERLLAQSWQDGLDEGSRRMAIDPLVFKRNETEILCPLALKTWWELKNRLVTESAYLCTSQPWVWKDSYGTEDAVNPAVSIPLPDLNSMLSGSFQGVGENRLPNTRVVPVQKSWEALLRSLSREGKEGGTVEREAFRKAVSALGLPDNGRYRLVLPVDQPGEKGLKNRSGPQGEGPLVLITAEFQ